MNDALKVNNGTVVAPMPHDNFNFLHRPFRNLNFDAKNLYGMRTQYRSTPLSSLFLRAALKVLHDQGNCSKEDLNYFNNQLFDCKYSWAIAHMMILSRLAQLFMLISISLRTCDRESMDAIGATQLLYFTCKLVRAPPHG